MNHDPFRDVVLPLYLAKRMLQNRDAVATDLSDQMIEIRRNGQFLGYVPIIDGCVNFRAMCLVLAMRH